MKKYKENKIYKTKTSLNANKTKVFFLKLIGSFFNILIAVLIAMSLATYNVFDPSPFTVTNDKAENLLGVPGSWLSSIILNIYGQVSWLIVFALLCFSRLSFTIKKKRFLLRILALLVTMITMSICYTYLGFEGGIIGKIILIRMINVFDKTYYFIDNIFYSILAIFSLTTFTWVCGFKISSLIIKSYLLLKKTCIFITTIVFFLIRLIISDKNKVGKIFNKKINLKKRKRIDSGLENKIKVNSEIDLNYKLPSIELLLKGKIIKKDEDQSFLEKTARILEKVLDDFGIKGEIVQVQTGPIVTRYELEPAPGTRSSRIIGLSDDIARSMSAVSARVSVVPGRNVIGIELPNSNRDLITIRDILDSRNFLLSKGLSLALGKSIAGEPVTADLGSMPHLLIAGTTGSGKSVAVNAMILSLLYKLKPEECRFIMVDPKMLELSVYEGIPHLLHPVVTEPRKAVFALKWLVREMNERYRQMSLVGVRNIEGYNKKINTLLTKKDVIKRKVQTGFDNATGSPVYQQQDIELKVLPLIVVVVDEIADLMLTAGKDIEMSIQSLAQKARAAGIHLILATQRPSVDVITGTIKANLPYRISFQVTSKIDSRTILGEQGAEQLLGKGDMLFMKGGGYTERIHGPFVSDEEVARVSAHLRKQGKPDYLLHITEENDIKNEGASLAEKDELYDKAIDLISRERKVSTSFLQRHLAIGYNRAARIVDALERKGIISSANAIGRREVLIPEND